MKPVKKLNRRVVQRLERIDVLPVHMHTTVLNSLYPMLKSVLPMRRQGNGR